MSFKIFLYIYLALGTTLFDGAKKLAILVQDLLRHLCVKKIMKLMGQQFMKFRLMILCIFSYGSHFCSVEQNCFGNLVEGGMSNIRLKLC